MRFRLKRIRVLCWCMAVLLASSAVLPATAFAHEKVDPNKTVTLTINHKVKDTPIAGVEFQLYRVARMTEDATFQAEADFEGSGVSLHTDASEESWSARAITMESYLISRIAAGRPIPAAASARTDRNGIATFSNLEVGLYLLVGKTKVIGSEIHTPLAIFISLPTLLENNSWDYTPSIYTKNLTQPRGETDINLSVIKVWKDTGHEQQRPAEITVTLYGNGAEYGTVKLSAANNWRHSWENLSSTTTWNLVEKPVPVNYTVTAIRDRNAFVVTNTYTEQPPDSPPPDKPGPSTPNKPGPSPSPGPSPTPAPAPSPVPTPAPSPVPSPTPPPPSPDIPSTDPPAPDTPVPDRPDTPTIPQTGQLWWPICMLAICGLALLLLGAKIRKHGKMNDESK